MVHHRHRPSPSMLCRRPSRKCSWAMILCVYFCNFCDFVTYLSTFSDNASKLSSISFLSFHHTRNWVLSEDAEASKNQSEKEEGTATFVKAATERHKDVIHATRQQLPPAKGSQQHAGHKAIAAACQGNQEKSESRSMVSMKPRQLNANLTIRIKVLKGVDTMT
ncbi:hypothetical protein NE237_017527 [Protea cynaroides]|uniref:Uncharacterized protein n=1 Tax=Protea cynaroides TaxID=273540 RepID=A0A9Q0K874_9MAGN|nr:hypothetical protein NE237_017527 [Protea cynaroides]